MWKDESLNRLNCHKWAHFAGLKKPSAGLAMPSHFADIAPSPAGPALMLGFWILLISWLALRSCRFQSRLSVAMPRRRGPGALPGTVGVPWHISRKGPLPCRDTWENPANRHTVCYRYDET